MTVLKSTSMKWSAATLCMAGHYWPDMEYYEARCQDWRLWPLVADSFIEVSLATVICTKPLNTVRRKLATVGSTEAIDRATRTSATNRPLPKRRVGRLQSSYRPLGVAP